MKARIIEGGALTIYRENHNSGQGGYKRQSCPFSRVGDCGNWCPHFRIVSGWLPGEEDKKSYYLELNCVSHPKHLELVDYDAASGQSKPVNKGL